MYLKKTSCPGEMFCVELANPPRIAACGPVFLFSQTGRGWGLAGVQAKLTGRRDWARKASLDWSHRLLTAFSLLPPPLIGRQWPGVLCLRVKSKAENALIMFCNFWKAPAVGDL